MIVSQAPASVARLEKGDPKHACSTSFLVFVAGKLVIGSSARIGGYLIAAILTIEP